MTFSADNITASVEKLVLSSISRPIDTLGTRRVDITFDNVQEAAAGVFLLNAAAPFYVAFLGAQSLLGLIQTETQTIDALFAAIAATGRQVFPITDLTPLNNASAALFNLNAAVGQRSQSFSTIQNIPAYQQFLANLNQFLNTAGSNIKSNGALVQTPQEAVAAIPGLVSTLQASHAQIAQLVTTLAGAIDDYNSVNLPSLAVSGVISRASQIIQQHAQNLAGLSATARLGALSPIVLDLLTSQAVVQKYGTFLASTVLYALTGTGNPYSDAMRPANGGSVTGNIHGPFAIIPNTNVLDLRYDAIVSARVSESVDSIAQVSGYKAQFNRATGSFITAGVIVGDVIYVNGGTNDGTRWMITSVTANAVQALGSVIPLADGSTPVEIWPVAGESIPLALSYVASIVGAAREPFDIVSGVSDILRLNINGTFILLTFTPGAQTAAALSASINAQLASASLDTVAVASPFLSPVRFDGLVNVTTVGSTGTFTLQVGQLDGLGVLIGDLIEILSGPNEGLVVVVTSFPGSPITYLQGVDGTLVPATGVRIQVGAAGMKLQINLVSPAAALAGAQTLSVASDNLSAGAALVLGFPTGATFTSRQTRAADLVTDLNSKMTKGTASRVLMPVTSAALGRSKPGNVSAVVLYRFSGQGDVVASPSTVAVTVAAGGLLVAGAQVGDILALRTGAHPDSVWTITMLTDTTLTATGSITTTSATGLSIEIGPALSSPAGRLFQITSGPNVGDYAVTGNLAVPFDLLLSNSLPVYQAGLNQPIFFSASLSFETIQISSKNTTTASRVTMNGFATAILSSVVPLAGGGTTKWFQLPSTPVDLSTEDFLDIYQSNYQTPSDSFGILTIDTSSNVIQLDHAIDSTISWVFGDQPPPFARLRSGQVYNYTVLQTQLKTWAALAVNQPSFFIDFNRFLNPLLVNGNPTVVQVNDTTNRLLALATVLDIADATAANAPTSSTLEAILDSYVVPSVPAVDTLLQSFSEKGSDRAVDLLTQGQFSTFFGLTLDGASYSGDMQQQMRAIAQQDLPVRKVDRNDASSSRQVAEVQDTDYEYATSDIDDVQIDPPVA